MAQLLENLYPGFRENGGGNTNENFTFGGVNVGSDQNVINILNANSTTTLTAGQSTSFVVLNANSGATITLPTPTPGTTFEFVVTGALTTGSYKIVTNNTATQSLIGAVSASIVGGNTNAAFTNSATSAVSLQFNGSTTGGTIGTTIVLTAISSTQWFVDGDSIASGVLATPFYTS